MDQFSGTFEKFADSAVTAVDGVGVFAALFLLVILLVALRPGERRFTRGAILLWLIGTTIVAVRATLPFPETIEESLRIAAVFLLLLSIGRSAFLIGVYIVLRGRPRPLPQIIRDIVQALIVVIVILVTLRAAGVALGSLLTTSAVLTAVIGLSMQETLGNLFAGLAIQAQRPFEVGDWIQVEGAGGEIIGRVVEINWRATRILTRDEFEVIVPNGAIAKVPLKNFSKPTRAHRRHVPVYGPYGVPPGRVHEVLLEAARDVPGVLPNPPPDVVTHSFGDSGVEYRVRFYIDDPWHTHRVESIVRDRIWYGLARAGIAIPFPVRDLYMHTTSPAGDARRAQSELQNREAALCEVDFLRVLPEPALKHAAEYASRRRYAPGEAIIRQGESGDELFIILRGDVVVLVGTPGQESEVARLRAGAYFGEMSLMTGAERAATVRAVGECEVLTVGKTAFKKILADAPELAERISGELARRQEALGALPASTLEHTHEMSRHQILDRIRAFFAL